MTANVLEKGKLLRQAFANQSALGGVAARVDVELVRPARSPVRRRGKLLQARVVRAPCQASQFRIRRRPMPCASQAWSRRRKARRQGQRRQGPRRRAKGRASCRSGLDGREEMKKRIHCVCRFCAQIGNKSEKLKTKNSTLGPDRDLNFTVMTSLNLC